MIMFAIPDKADRACFAMTCVRIFSLVEEHWLEHFTEDIRRPRLLCAGDYARWKDVGRESLKAFRTLKHQKSMILLDLTEKDYDTGKFMKKASPYQVIGALPLLPAHQPSRKAKKDPLTTSLRQIGQVVWKRLVRDLPPAERPSDDQYSSESFASVKHMLPEASILYRSLLHPQVTGPRDSALVKPPRVLRNHTKKVFVLEQPMFSELKGMYGGPLPTLGHVALSQVCRSQEGDSTMKSVNTFGGWPGNELDVISESDFVEHLKTMKLEDVQSWNNITPLVLRLLEGIIGDDPDCRRYPSSEAQESLRNKVAHQGATAEQLLPKYKEEAT